jgi:hypothetical protein
MKLLKYGLFYFARFLVVFSFLSVGRILVKLGASGSFQITFNFFVLPLCVAAGIWIAQIILGHLRNDANRYFSSAGA